MASPLIRSSSSFILLSSLFISCNNLNSIKATSSSCGIKKHQFFENRETFSFDSLENLLPQDCGRVSTIDFSDYSAYQCYARYQNEPTKTNRFIREGYVARKGEFPSIARLDVRFADESRLLCSGTLISDRLIITAAHCVTSAIRYNPKEIKVGLGLSGSESAKYETNAAAACWPPNYNSVTGYHDIAILVLRQKAPLNEYSIWPACLDFREPKKYSARCLTVGTGARFPADGNRGQVAAMHTLDCSPIFGGIGEKCLRGMGAVCPGDSGGPTYCIDNCNGTAKQVVVGVTGFSETCLPGNPGFNDFKTAWIPGLKYVIRDLLRECSG